VGVTSPIIAAGGGLLLFDEVLFRLQTCLVSFCKRGCRIRALLRTRAGEFRSVLSNVSTLYMGCWKFLERGDMRRWKVEEQGEMGREMKRERSCDIGRESRYTHTHRGTHTQMRTRFLSMGGHTQQMTRVCRIHSCVHTIQAMTDAILH